MRIRYAILGLVLWAVSINAQDTAAEPPKLVVGLIVDQMRFDFLERYQEHFGEGGFKRLMREGYSFENTHYNYIPTVTAAGHASIYTGVTPSVHGVIDNSWYERESNRMVSNVGDPAVRIVGSLVEGTSGYSPARLVTRTITDQLREESNSQAKVISVSLKDRGAILPGGHSPNAALLERLGKQSRAFCKQFIIIWKNCPPG